jgi:hypothetical protein
MNKEIQAYNDSQSDEDRNICNSIICRVINLRTCPSAESTRSGTHIPCGFWMETPLWDIADRKPESG